MTNKANLRIGSFIERKMARVLTLILAASAVGASSPGEEVALANITRSASGDYFSLKGEFFFCMIFFISMSFDDDFLTLSNILSHVITCLY